MKMPRLFLIAAALVLAGFARADGARPATRIDLTSQPEGASVIIDGVDRGVTPLTLLDLAPGRHHVKMRLAGYVERDRMLNVEAGVPTQRSAVLETEKGLLLLLSDPPDCAISIDGQACGRTPRLVTTLDAKDRHRVTYRKAGYRAATFDVKFSGRTPLVRREALVLDSGIVKVITEPAGASVTVNGIGKGRTPAEVRDVPKGRATVRLQLDGYAEEVRELAVNAGDKQTLSVALKPLPGTVAVSSVPEGARIYLNGLMRGKAPLTLCDLVPGTYELKAELEGWGTQTRKVEVAKGGSLREEFKLSNVKGRLEVRTAPPGATVLVDGHRVGMTKASAAGAEHSDALAVEGLLEGEHVLVVRADGCAEVTKHPLVESQKTTKVDLRLKRLFIPDVEVETDQGVVRGVYVSSTAEYYTIEITPGVQKSIPRTSVRRFGFLNGKKP